MSKNNKLTKFNRIKICYYLLLITLIFGIYNLHRLTPTYTRYYSQVTANVVGYAKETRHATYTVTFDSNGGTGTTMSAQTITYGISTQLSPNTYTKTGYVFDSWNTSPDGTGTRYLDEQAITNTTEPTIALYAQWTQKVAEYNGVYYDTLQLAIDDVPKTGVLSTVRLLKNTNENIETYAGQNIVLNLQNNILKEPGTKAVITNKATLEITNGIVRSSATTDGAINNESTGVLKVTSGTVEMTASGGKQAIYNKAGGRVEISGTAYISSASRSRGTAQNLSGGTFVITGGTIIASGTQSAVVNAGTMTIGTEGGSVDTSSPVMQGAAYGIESTTNFSFYDGIAKGKTKGISNEAKATNKETGYQIASAEETISGTKYKTAYLAKTVTVTFDAHGGSSSESTRNIEVGLPIGTLPTAIRSGYLFDGWFTLENGGDEILPSREIHGNDTFHAHWTKISVAEIDGTEYNTLQEAINAVPANGTKTTVKLIADTAENVTVKPGQNIVFNLQTYTLSNLTDVSVITNEGDIEITSGTITSSAAAATIDNNKTGTLKVSGGNIIATGTRSAIFNNGTGTVEITGSAYLCSSATGKPTSTSLDRGTVHNANTSGAIIITGGTIVGLKQQAVSNLGTLIIGTKEDGNISMSSPEIRGETYGVQSTKPFKYYDGIIKGITAAIDGTISEQEPNTQITSGTETIGGKTYITNYLETI